jgi:hypothetical protein
VSGRRDSTILSTSKASADGNTVVNMDVSKGTSSSAIKLAPMQHLQIASRAFSARTSIGMSMAGAFDLARFCHTTYIKRQN